MNKIASRLMKMEDSSLKKIAADTNTYKFVSNYAIQQVTEDELGNFSEAEYSPSMIDDSIVSAEFVNMNSVSKFLKDEFTKVKDDLISIMSEHEEINVTGMDIYIDGNDVISEITVDGELTKEQIERVKEHLTGQFADGFGEGLEQKELCEIVEKDTEVVYDEDNDEEEEIEYNITNTYYLKLWPDNFKIKLIS